MAMFECEFPTDVAFLAMGGPSFFTTLNEGFSGDDQANRNWKQTRGKWKIDLNYKDGTYWQAVLAFFLNVGGQADPFRFKDHKDFQASGELLGVGDGSNPTFQLVKTYTTGSRSYQRQILKPITSAVPKFDGSSCEDTVKIYVAAVLKTAGTDYNLDETTGVVTFLAGHIPTAGQAITASFQFHYPVRFMNDDLQAQIEASPVEGGLGDPLITWPQIELREVKNP